MTLSPINYQCVFLPDSLMERRIKSWDAKTITADCKTALELCSEGKQAALRCCDTEWAEKTTGGVWELLVCKKIARQRLKCRSQSQEHRHFFPAIKLPGSSVLWGPLPKPTDFRFSAWLTWIEIKWFNLAAHLDFPNLLDWFESCLKSRSAPAHLKRSLYVVKSTTEGNIWGCSVLK